MANEQVKHVCPVCGYVHEENEHTSFESMPIDYVCPTCGVEKVFFEEQYV